MKAEKLQVECPQCNYQFIPIQQLRHVVMESRKLIHTLSTQLAAGNKYGKTLCGKLVDFDVDRIFEGLPGRDDECSVCKGMSPGGEFKNPKQEGLF